MNGFSAVNNKLLVAALAFLPAVFVPQASAGTIALPIGTNVTVTNSSLPVTGSVTVSNTPVNPVPVSITGNVSVGGTSNVNVTNTPSVSIANSSLNVSDVNNPAFQPYTTQTASITCGTDFAVVYFPVVPTGKTLVIEMVSLQFDLPNPMSLFGTSLGTSLPSGHLSTFVPSVARFSDGAFNYYGASQAVRYYSGANSQVTVQVSGYAPASYTGNHQVCIQSAAISGYLVNTP